MKFHLRSDRAVAEESCCCCVVFGGSNLFVLCVDCEEEEVTDVMILEFIEDGANAVAAPRRNRRERILFIIVLLSAPLMYRIGAVGQQEGEGGAKWEMGKVRTSPFCRGDTNNAR